MAKSRVLPLFCFLLAYSVSLVSADFFNDYFDDKVFGIDPGPCPSDAESCDIDLDTTDLPPSIANIEFCLFRIQLFGFIDFELICDSLGDWVQDGDVELFEVQCDDISVGSITLENNERDTPNFLSNRISVERLQQSCRGRVRLINVLLAGQARLLVNGVSRFSTNPRRDGIDIAFDLELRAAGGFEQNLVDDAQVENCNLVIDLGLSVSDTRDFSISLLGSAPLGLSFIADEVLNLVFRIIEAAWGVTLCDVAEQAGTLDDGSLGILNVVLEEINERYDELIVPVTIDVPGRDNLLVNDPISFDITQTDLDNSLVLRDSNALEALAVTLNDFLGNPEVRPLRVNQAINLLTDPDGTFLFDFNERDLSQEFPLSFANVSARLLQVQLVGLNTINDFDMFQNGFDASSLFFTLEHFFGIETFQFRFTVEAILKRGEWVTQSSCGNFPNFIDGCTSDEERFTFDFGLTVRGIELRAATLTAFNFNEIEEIEIGRVFDVDVFEFASTFEKILACIAPSVYVFEFSELNFTLTSVSEPVVDNISGDGVDQLILNSVDLFNDIAAGLIRNDMDKIVQGPIRDELNEFLRVNVSAVRVLDEEACPPYVQVPSEDPFIDFTTDPVNGIFPIINEVLGNFEADSDVDINDFIQVILEYLSDNSEEFPLERAGADGDWRTKATQTPLQQLFAFSEAFPGANQAFFELTDLTIFNLDAINKFQSREPTPDKPRGFSFELGFADTETLEFGVGFRVFAPAPLNNDEDFDFIVRLVGVDLEVFVDELLINLDEFQRLTFQQTTHLPCLQAVIDGFLADEFASSAVASNINFEIQFTSAPSGSGLDNALRVLATEFQNSASNARFTALTNYFFEIGFEAGLQSLEQSNFTVTPEICSELESDLSSIFQIFTGIGGFDQDLLGEECLAPIEALEDISVFEESKFFGFNRDAFIKFQDNFIIDTIASLLEVSTEDDVEGESGTLDNLLFTLGEAEGNFLVDLFVIEPSTVEGQNDTVAFVLPLNEENEVLNAFNLSAFSIKNDEGFIAEAQTLRIRQLNKFLERVNLFETPSDFTTRHTIGFSNETSLEVEIIALLQVNATIVDGDPIDTPPIQEFITLTLTLSGIDVIFEIFTPLLDAAFKSLTVGHFLSVNENQQFGFASTAADCFLGSIPPGMAEVREFKIDFVDIGTPEVITTQNNLVSDGVQGIIREVSKLFLEFYAKAIPNICQNCLREIMNDELRRRTEIANEPGRCGLNNQHVTLAEGNEFFRYSDSQAYRDFQNFLIDVMYADDFNLLNLFIEGVTSEAFFDTNPFSTGNLTLTYKDVDYGQLEIELLNLFIQGLNTMTFFQFFEPIFRDQVEEFDEENDPFRVVLAFNHTGETSYEISTIITGYEFFVQDDVVSNAVELTFDFRNFSIRLETLLQIDLNILMNLRFNQIDTFDEVPCLIQPIRKFDVLDFNIAVGEIVVTIDCFADCDSPLLETLTIGGPSVSSNSDELAEVFQNSIAFVIAYIESSPAQRLINAALESSEDNCDVLISGVEDLLEAEPDGTSVFFLLFGVCVFLAYLLYCFMLCQYPRHRKKLGNRIQEFEASKKEYDIEDELDLFTNEVKALIWSPAVPVAIKIFTPLLCIFNISILTWAVTTQGALTILITFTVLGMEMQTIDLVPFTVISTVDDLWNSGGWYLSFLIVGLSFLWPVIKNMSLMFLWFIPTTIVKEDSRGSWLEFLDVMGKWSFVDVFVVVMTLAALATSINLSQQDELSFVDDTFFQTVVTMTPEVGIIILSLVSATSLCANHIMSFYHRKTQFYYRHQFDLVAGHTEVPKRALQKKKMSTYRFAGRQIVANKFILLSVLNVLSALFTVVGVFGPLVRFELRGLVGLLLEEFDESETVREYSVFSLGAVLFGTAPRNFGEGVIISMFVFLYFAVAVIGPILQVIVIQIILMKKFNYANFDTMIYVVMLVSFWTALDVVLIGVAATLLQITNVTTFIIDFITNDICTNIQTGLTLFVPDEEDASCLEIIGYFEWAAGFLLLGTLGQLAVHGLTMVLATRMKQDWYYFAYVLHGHRKRESKPKKLTFLRDRVYKFFTVPNKRKKRLEEKPESEEESDEVKIDTKAGVSSANPRFTQKSENLPVAKFGNENETVVSPPQRNNRSLGTDIFAAMGELPKDNKQVKRSPMPSIDDLEV